MVNLQSIMKNGFKRSGLLPFNVNEIDYNCLKKVEKKEVLSCRTSRCAVF